MVEDALIEATVDSYGDEALQVTVLLPSTEPPKIEGRSFVRFLSDLRDRLESEGERRRPIPIYMTREDLAADVDFEP